MASPERVTGSDRIDAWRTQVAVWASCVLLALAGAFAVGALIISVILPDAPVMVASPGPLTESLLAAFLLAIFFAGVLVAATLRPNGPVARYLPKIRAEDRAKHLFISLISHNLRTPLSEIKWLAEYLESGEAGRMTVGQRRTVRDIIAAEHRVNAFVNDIVLAARIEGGTQRFSRERVDLRVLALHVARDSAEAAAAARVRITTEGSRVSALVLADSSLLHQALGKLVRNAIAYTPPRGKVTITVAVRGRSASITVADTGIGIPPVEQAHIFQKFYRGDTVMRTKADGTGLGLYLVRMIVERCGGRVGFRSAVGKGSSFTLTFPTLPAA